MGKVLDFIQKKKEREKRAAKTSGSSTFQERLLKHRLTVMYRIVLGVVCVAAVAGISISQMRNRIFTSWVELSQADKTFNSDAGIRALGECALVYSHDGATCVDRRGEAVWNQTFEMQEPMVDVRGGEAAIGDYNGHTIYLMNAQSVHGSIDTGMPIKGFAVSGQGVVAAILDDSENVTWIYLFDSSGSVIAYFKTTMRQSGYPVSLSISNDASLVAVSYLFMDKSVLKSSVAFYNFGPVGRNEIDNFVSSYDYTNTVVPFVKFLETDSAVAVADGRLTFFGGGQKPVSQAEVIIDGEIRGVYWGGDYVALVYNDVTGEASYKIDIYDASGRLSDSVKTNLQFTDIIIRNDKIMIYNGQECIYHTIGGMDNFTGEFPGIVQHLIPMNASHEFMAVTTEGVRVLRLA